MAKKFKQFGPVERILMHLQNAPIYNIKYRNEESEQKALRANKHRESGRGDCHKRRKSEHEEV